MRRMTRLTSTLLQNEQVFVRAGHGAIVTVQDARRHNSSSVLVLGPAFGRGPTLY